MTHRENGVAGLALLRYTQPAFSESVMNLAAIFSLINALAHTLHAYRIPKQRFTAVPAENDDPRFPGTLSIGAAIISQPDPGGFQKKSDLEKTKSHPTGTLILPSWEIRPEEKSVRDKYGE